MIYCLLFFKGLVPKVYSLWLCLQVSIKSTSAFCSNICTFQISHNKMCHQVNHSTSSWQAILELKEIWELQHEERFPVNNNLNLSHFVTMSCHLEYNAVIWTYFVVLLWFTIPPFYTHIPCTPLCCPFLLYNKYGVFAAYQLMNLYVPPTSTATGSLPHTCHISSLWPLTPLARLSSRPLTIEINQWTIIRSTWRI